MFEIVWAYEAMEELDQLFLAEAPIIQARLVGIVRGIEQSLARNAHQLGESRDQNTRIAFFDLLALRYLIDDHNKVVRVTRVRRYGK